MSGKGKGGGKGYYEGGGGKGYEGGKGGGKGYEGGGKGFDGGKGKGKGKGGSGPRPRYQAFRADTTAPPELRNRPAAFIGAISWSGRDSERGGEVEEFATSGRAFEGRAKMGEEFDVIVNMCPLNLSEQQRNLYRVDFEPEQEDRRRRRYAVMQAFGNTGQPVAYDGDHLLYAANLINNQRQLSETVQLALPNNQTENVTVRLEWTSHQVAQLNQESVMFFCTRFKAGMSAQADRICIDRDYYDLGSADVVPEHSCQLAPGLSQTVYVTNCGPVLNVDMMFKHIRTDTVWDLMQQMQTQYGPRAQEAIEHAFQRKSVMPTYWDPKRCVIADRVRFDLSPQSTFNHRGQQKTYAAYIRDKYGLTLNINPRQPLLENESRTKRDPDGNFQKTYFIPQLCWLTGLTDDMKNDRFRCRELIKKTALPPGDRLTKIQQNLAHLTGNAAFQQALQPWGINISPKLLKFKTRRLPTPAVRNGSGLVQVNEDSEAWVIKGAFDMFQKAQCFDKWAILTFQATDQVRELIDNLMYLGDHDFGIPMSQPRVFDTQGDRRPAAYKTALEKQVAPAGPKFLVVVLPTVSDEPYRTLKQLLGKYGVPSQFVSNRNLEKDALTKATKIMVQMNCKGLGAPWTVDAKMGKPTMFVGLDVHHGGDLEHKGGSVAAFVATLNRECTKYYSRTFMVRPRQQELEKMLPEGQGLKELAQAAIEQFKKTNSVPPENIIVYRDGGSEGELSRISRYEVKQFQQAAEAAGIKTFIVVLKKVRTRFFMVNPANSQEVGNPLPGTIVDRHITNCTIPEFFLCCQHVNQGSATATKYQVVFDDSKLNVDSLQMYTYCLSHLYFNWLGTIRVPAVVKYASTLAKFTGQFLRGVEVNEKLWDKLHYL